MMTIKAEQSLSFDQHERVSYLHDHKTGLKAFIAIHNTNLGPAVGGCRMYNYASEAQALEDVLRLSRGMTYKSALAGLPMGGGKAVIIGDPKRDKSPKLLQAMGRFIDSHQGDYVSAEDSGMGVKDMQVFAKETSHVLGIATDQAYGGDPSPLTAKGIFNGIQAAAEYRFGKASLDGLTVSIQGVGSVGYHLCDLLLQSKVRVKVADVNQTNLKNAIALGAEEVDVEQIHKTQADIFSPCAMGAILNDVTIPELSAPIIVGGANNQLARAYHAKVLKSRQVLYAPDFVVNAGGIIEIYRQFKNVSSEECKAKIDRIGATLLEIFERSDSSKLDTAQVAEQMAESIFRPSQVSDSNACAA